MFHTKFLLTKALVIIFTLIPSLSIGNEKNMFTKIACCGDSLTYGLGLKNRETESYPANLSRLLGSEIEVRNFGASGSCALRKYAKAYHRHPSYKDAINYKPDVVLLMLGTNDSLPWYWTTSKDFETDYKKLINTFQKNGATVYCILPTTIFNKEVDVALSKVAKLTNCKLIKLPTNLPTFDKVHLTAEGYTAISKIIASSIN